MTSVMTQTPMYDYYGVESCYAFWTVTNFYLTEATVSGFGMAVFPFDLFPLLVQERNQSKSANEEHLDFWKGSCACYHVVGDSRGGK